MLRLDASCAGLCEPGRARLGPAGGRAGASGWPFQAPSALSQGLKLRIDRKVAEGGWDPLDFSLLILNIILNLSLDAAAEYGLFRRCSVAHHAAGARRHPRRSPSPCPARPRTLFRSEPEPIRGVREEHRSLAERALRRLLVGNRFPFAGGARERSTLSHTRAAIRATVAVSLMASSSTAAPTMRMRSAA